MSFNKELAELIAASSGTYTISTTSEFTGDALAYWVGADAVIADLHRSDSGNTNVRAEYSDNSGAATHPAGTLITPNWQAGKYFTAITLTSGTVVAILR